MTIYLATDHVGYELKEKLKKFLTEGGYAVEDCGAYKLDPEDDYPDFITKAAEAVSKDPVNNRAIILGGSGQGEAMVANRYKGVRAAVFYGVPKNGKAEIEESDFQIVKLSREHNDANILSLGAHFLDHSIALSAVRLWLATAFSEDVRHKRRIEKF